MPEPARCRRRSSPGRPGSRPRHQPRVRCRSSTLRGGPAVSWPGRRPAPSFDDARAGLRSVLRSPARAVHRVRRRRPALHDHRGERCVPRGDQHRATRRARPPRAPAVPDLPGSAVRSMATETANLASRCTACCGTARPTAWRCSGSSRATPRGAWRSDTGRPSTRRCSTTRRGGVHRPSRGGRDGPVGRALRRALVRRARAGGGRRSWTTPSPRRRWRSPCSADRSTCSRRATARTGRSPAIVRSSGCPCARRFPRWTSRRSWRCSTRCGRRGRRTS